MKAISEMTHARGIEVVVDGAPASPTYLTRYWVDRLAKLPSVRFLTVEEAARQGLPKA